jgi:hypothetical protein
MRYLKSWVFDSGLALIIAGTALANSVHGQTYALSPQPSEAPVIQFKAEYTDYDARLPIALVGSGLVVLIVAAVRAHIPRR